MKCKPIDREFNIYGFRLRSHSDTLKQMKKGPKSKSLKLTKELKYQLYEASVQEVDVDVVFFSDVYKEFKRSHAKTLREDFCGTHWLCTEWVKSHSQRTALGIDLNQEPLNIGKKFHVEKLPTNIRQRVSTRLQNVKIVTPEKFDLIVASNFSYFIFKQRKSLLEYFKGVRMSLNKKGLFILDHFGGPGASEIGKESRNFKVNSKSFQYIWHAEYANLFNGDVLFHIHYKDNASKVTFEKVFSYDWRLWTVPEIWDIAQEAGFSKIHIFQDIDGEYKLRKEPSEEDSSWLLQIVLEY